MSDDRSTFEATRARLEDIVMQVRRKDVSLEQSLDMLEEAVRLVNQCNELIDQTSFRANAQAESSESDASQDAGSGGATGRVVETVDVSEDGIVEVIESIEVVSSEPGDAAPEAEAESDSDDAEADADADDDGWGVSDAWEAPEAETDSDMEDDARE